MEWNILAQNRYRLQDFVNALIKFRVPQNAEISSLAVNLLPSQEGLCSVELVS
jgi:hypothetical protein